MSSVAFKMFYVIPVRLKIILFDSHLEALLGHFLEVPGVQLGPDSLLQKLAEVLLPQFTLGYSLVYSARQPPSPHYVIVGDYTFQSNSIVWVQHKDFFNQVFKLASGVFVREIQLAVQHV